MLLTIYKIFALNFFDQQITYGRIFYSISVIACICTSSIYTNIWLSQYIFQQDILLSSLWYMEKASCTITYIIYVTQILFGHKTHGKLFANIMELRSQCNLLQNWNFLVTEFILNATILVLFYLNIFLHHDIYNDVKGFVSILTSMHAMLTIYLAESYGLFVILTINSCFKHLNNDLRVLPLKITEIRNTRRTYNTLCVIVSNLIDALKFHILFGACLTFVELSFGVFNCMENILRRKDIFVNIIFAVWSLHFPFKLFYIFYKFDDIVSEVNYLQ